MFGMCAKKVDNYVIFQFFFFLKTKKVKLVYLKIRLFMICHWRRQMATHSSTLAWKIP